MDWVGSWEDRRLVGVLGEEGEEYHGDVVGFPGSGPVQEKSQEHAEPAEGGDYWEDLGVLGETL